VFVSRVRREEETPYWCDKAQAGFGFNNYAAIKKWCADNGF
jgi:hypothetical protein